MNTKLKYISREELKPYADSEKLGYIFILGTIEESQKHVFKDKVLAKPIIVSVKKLVWLDKNRPPKVLSERVGVIDHAYVPPEITKFRQDNAFESGVQIVSYQRDDGSTSYGFEELPHEKRLCANLLRFIEAVTRTKLNSASRLKVANCMTDSIERLRISYEQRGGKGFGSLAMVNIDYELILASLNIIDRLREKKKTTTRTKKKKTKGFASVKSF